MLPPVKYGMIYPCRIIGKNGVFVGKEKIGFEIWRSECSSKRQQMP
jgi:hypothetical protein